MKTDTHPPRSLSRVFIERPRLAAVVAIVMAVAGIIALPHLAMEEFPEIAPPQIYVSATYAGADAQSVIETVATPIEDELNVVEGLSYYTSTCDSLGGYSCTLTFESGTNTDLAMVNVQNAVKRAEPLLPKPAPVPETLEWDLWLGSAAERPYAEWVYHPLIWRIWRDLGSGWIGDIGCHLIAAAWRGMDLGSTPVKSVFAETITDAKARRFDNAAANAFLTRDYRKGWEIPGLA